MTSSRTLAQARWESRLLLRNGEQLLLTIVIPVGLLLLLAWTDTIPMPAGGVPSDGPGRLSASLATVITVAVISTAFTSLAIATAFERRSGALRLLATTPLRPRDLLVGKLLATMGVTLLSTVIVVTAAVVLGWRPASGSVWTLPVLLLGVAAWLPWGLVLAGTFRAEAVLAAANGLFLVAISIGGVVIPPSSLPGAWGAVVAYLPSGALDQAMTVALTEGALDPVAAAVLVIWAAGGALAAARLFRWT